MSADRNLTKQDYELLSAYLDGALSEAERTALEARLTAENNLRQELEALRQTVALVKGVAPIRAPRNYTLTADMVRPPRWIIFPTTAAFSAMSAAAAMILLFIGATLLLNQSSTAMFNPSTANVQHEEETQPQIAAQPTINATPALEQQAEQTDDILLASAVPPSSAGEDGFSLETDATFSMTMTVPEGFAFEYFASVTPTGAVEPSEFAPAAPQATQPFTGEEDAEGVSSETAQESPVDESQAAEPENAAGAAMADTAAQAPSETASSERELPTATLTSTVTVQPTQTASYTPSPTSTVTPTTAPTLSPVPTLTPVSPTSIGNNLLAPGLLVLGLILLAVAIVTTWIRTRR